MVLKGGITMPSYTALRRRAQAIRWRLPGFLPNMKKIIPLGFKMGSGKGWRYTWFMGDPKDRYHFECNECLYKHEFGKRGLLGRS